VRDKDIKQLKVPYSSTMPPGPNDVRLAAALGLKVERGIELGDRLLADLSNLACGFGWWTAYPEIDRQTRIFLSDHLVSCARAIATNLIEAHAEGLEFRHALDEFRVYMSRGIKKNSFVTPAPRGLYEDLIHYRVTGHFVGILRGLGSALDCLGACLVGIAALPTSLVKADWNSALNVLRKPGSDPIQEALLADIQQAIIDAGPSGWVQWLLAMRNTDVHRGRRVASFSAVRDARKEVVGFAMQLPRVPELTEVEAWVDAGGYVAAYFEAPADDLIVNITASVNTLIENVSDLLITLWARRREDPGLLPQPLAQWKPAMQLITGLGRFTGYASGVPLPDSDVTEIGVADEMHRRISAAGLGRIGSVDLHPWPDVWNQGSG
jgi:hypothetical protein